MKRLCYLVLVGLVSLGVAGVSSAIPQLINYQGYLTDDSGVPVADGNYQLTFGIYDVETGGAAVWTETHAAVPVTNGLFNVILGGDSPLTLPFDVDYWLGVQIGAEPELPRVRLTSVGYSYRASWADTADYSVGAPRDDDWTPDTAGINIYRLTGNVGIGTPAPQEKLEIVGNLLLNTSHAIAFVGEVKSSRADGGLYVRPDSGCILSLGYGNAVSIVDRSVGIGTATPGAKLHVEGANEIKFFGPGTGGFPQLKVGRNTDADSNIILGFNSENNFGYLAVAGDMSSTFVVADGGNIGIGTTTPGYTLDVAGDIHCTGKLTSDGGNDPPYVLYNKETRKAIRERVAKEVPEDKLDGAILFWNGENVRFEVYLPAKGEFRDLAGNLLHKTAEFSSGE